ncbi:hypothetical protein J132_05150 [Termitomyces sp. J132]|nr:hypothetical protein J132_05150 [Termitomyces sp. J132]
MAPWPTSMPSPQPLTLALDLPNPENHPAVPDLCHPSSTQHPGSSDPFRSITTTSGRPAFPNDPINVSARPDPRSQLTPTHSVELHQAPPPQPTYPEVLCLPVLSQSPGLVFVTTRSPKPRTSSIKTPNPQKDPQRSAELPPMPRAYFG